MIEAGGTIGILGGGQLARMLSVAASRIGYKTHIYDPDPNSPAFDVATFKTVGSFYDHSLLEEFAKKTNIITFEFENIPNSALDEIEKFTPIFPPKNALSISQDRIKEKEFFGRLGLQTARYAKINSVSDFLMAFSDFNSPSILKTRRDGYDGKGQMLVTENTKQSEIEKHLLLGPCILENFIKFRKELSVIIARNDAGEVVSFDPGENVHKSGILHSTTVPAQINNSLKLESIITAGKIANALKYVGILGVELFLTEEKKIIVNEIAPRVHNSGHWTQNGCIIDQFEQHIRAISGRSLGDGQRHSDVRMENILGTEINKSLNIVSGAIHLYGKKEIRNGRKMGHINYVSQKTF